MTLFVVVKLHGLRDVCFVSVTLLPCTRIVYNVQLYTIFKCWLDTLYGLTSGGHMTCKIPLQRCPKVFLKNEVLGTIWPRMGPRSAETKTVLCTIIMVHGGTSSSYSSVNCIGL